MNNTRYNIYEEKHRVIAYARISTLDEEQQVSLLNQKEYFEKVINDNPNWELVDIIYDEASGASVKNRDGFKSLIERAKNNEYDLLITKEQSRFSRNVIETLTYLKELKTYNVEAFFLLDNIYTGDADSMLRLQIMASIYENEILRISQRVKFGHRKNFESGKVYGSYVYGYNLHEGKLTINTETSQVVKEIYRLFLDDGLGYRAIKIKLESDNILSPLGLNKWSITTIKHILTSEKMKGCLLQQKSITENHLTKKRKKNDGKKEHFVYLENTHEPIIDKETWDLVQNEIDKRANFYKHKVNNISGRYSAKYPYSSKLICGKCGSTFRRKIYNKHKDGTYTHAWFCGNNIDNGKNACESKAISEYILDEIMLRIIKELFKNKDDILFAFKLALKDSMINNDYEKDIQKLISEIDKIKNRNDNLLDLMLDGTISKEVFKNKKKLLDKDIQEKQDALNMYKNKSENLGTINNRILKLYNICNDKVNLNDKIIVDNIIRHILEKVIIYDRDNLEVYLNINISFKASKNKQTPFVIVPMHSKQQKVVDNILIIDDIYDLSNIVIPTVSMVKYYYKAINLKVYINF